MRLFMHLQGSLHGMQNLESLRTVELFFDAAKRNPYDVAMVKDNHKIAAGSITAAYQLVVERFPDVDVQVEVTTAAEAVEAVSAGARFLLCDNMTPDRIPEEHSARMVAGSADSIAEQVKAKVLDAGIGGVIVNMPAYEPGVIAAVGDALRPLVGL